ncbi:hypothetical protein DZJ_44610 [Dickeya ananatis]
MLAQQIFWRGWGLLLVRSNLKSGGEVREAFLQVDPIADCAFVPRNGKFLADIYQLARLRLEAAGVTQVFGGEYCTVSDSGRFFSYRRDGMTGRMATLIWLI